MLSVERIGTYSKYVVGEIALVFIEIDFKSKNENPPLTPPKSGIVNRQEANNCKTGSIIWKNHT